MTTIVLVIHLILAIALVAVVLLQRSEGGGLGIGGGGGGLISVRGTANLLTRVTAVIAVAFMATSLTLAILAGYGKEAGSILDTAPTQTPTQTPTEQQPQQPAVPLSK